MVNNYWETGKSRMGDRKSKLDEAAEGIVSIAHLFGVGYDPVRMGNTTDTPTDINKVQRTTRAFLAASTKQAVPESPGFTGIQPDVATAMNTRRLQVRSANGLRV